MRSCPTRIHQRQFAYGVANNFPIRSGARVGDVVLRVCDRLVERELRRLVDRVRANGGAARVLRITFDDGNEEAQLVTELQTARDDEYGEVLERVPAFLSELRSERDRDRATYEEVEESEADLERFRAWLAKIDRRDYFRAPRRADAHAAVERCARALEAFESEAFARDERPAAEPPPTLRAVQDTR
jgi:hypothetical protein